MVKTAAKKKTTTSEPSALDFMATLEIKQRFIGEALNLGWRLVVTFVIPVIFGVWLDRRFDAKPVYTLAGIVVAMGASIVVIRQTVKTVNENMATPIRKKKNHA